MSSISVESSVRSERLTRRRDARSIEDDGRPGLPPVVGAHLLFISFGLAQPYDRARSLEAYGYRVSACGEPRQAPEHLAGLAPDAVVIDLAREHASPHEVVALVRSATLAPVVVVGCDGTYPEMLRCFEAGADDYCRPRCPTEEIDIRLRAVFRRKGFESSARRATPLEPVMRVGQIEIDRQARIVRKHGEVVALSPTEYRLLATLAEHLGEVIPSKALIARVWGDQCVGESHYLRLYIRYLRQKLEDDPSHPQYIVNRWGTGYTLDAPQAA